LPAAKVQAQVAEEWVEQRAAHEHCQVARPSQPISAR
jgi:hypothetical protein